MNQVHKETLTNVDNSLPNRQGLEVEIFGMEGIPEDVAQAHNQRIIAQYYQAEAERRAATGNPGPGGAQGAAGQPKKPKFESPSDLKKRLAEHKARIAEQAAGGGSSGGNTPLAGEQNSPPGQSPAAFVCLIYSREKIFHNTNAMQNAAPFPPQQAGYGGNQGAGYGSYSQEPYTQTATAYQQPFAQQPPFSGPPGAQYQAQYSPPQQYPTTQSFPPTSYQPPSFGAGSPPNSFNGFQPPPSHTPPQHSGLPNRPPSLPPAPGLPQRPSFGAPVVPPYQMQQMHQGPPQGGWNENGWKGQDQNAAMSSAYPPHSQSYNGATNASTVDDLVSGAAREADDIDEIIRMAEAGIKPPKKVDALATSLPAPEAAIPPSVPAVETAVKSEEVEKSETGEKKSKKEKSIRMIYSDLELSPEERMAKMPRYAFSPDDTMKTSLVDTTTIPGVAGVVDI